MNNIAFYALIVVIGYFCGCLQCGYIVGRLNNIDIRDYGSGNAGATNVLRVLGKVSSLCTFLGDALKGFIPVLILKYLVCPGMPDVNSQFAQLLIGFAAVMGHDYPFYLKFKGGKGISTSAAVMMAFDWRMGVISFLIFVVVVFCTRYVSLGSCLLSVAFVIEMAVFHPGRIELLVMAVLFAFFAIYRHRANIKRLMNGTESKIGQKVEVKK